MVNKEDIKREAIECAKNTIVQCPYCRKSYFVPSGWFFNNNQQTSTDGNKIGSQYIANHLDNYLRGKE